MNPIRTLLSRFVAMFRRSTLDAQLDEELQAHIDLAIEEKVSLGMSPAAARTAALREFGGVTQTREAYRQHRGFPLLDEIFRDVRFGMRQLYRAPGFALTAILTLALGLGANAAIFSLVNALLLRPLAVPHAEQLLLIKTDSNASDESSYYHCAPMLHIVENRHDLFTAAAATTMRSLQVRSSSGMQQLPGLMVSGQFFQVMETAPLLGRYLEPADDQHKGSSSGYAVVLSEAFWRTWFHGSPDILGHSLTLSNIPFTIVGVMPASLHGADPTQHPSFYIPLSTEPVLDAPYNNLDSGYNAFWLNIIARRQANISAEQINAALLSSSLSSFQATGADPEWIKRARTNNLHFAVEEGSRGYTNLRATFRKPLTVVMILCGGVLLIACLNLASLLMARAAARERELATRLAIGATRFRIVQQLLVETFLIVSMGTAAGLTLSPLVSHALAALLVGKQRAFYQDTYLDTSLDFRVFAFAAVVTILAGLLIGLLPALRATAGDLNVHIKNGSHSRSAQDRRRLLPRILMSFEIAIALLLVFGAGLLAASLTRLYRTGLGFDPKPVANFQISMSTQQFKGAAVGRLYQQFAETLGQQPGVEAVSFDEITPISGSMMSYMISTPLSKGPQNIVTDLVAPRYFEAMHIPMMQGHDFSWTDTNASSRKIVLNESAAKLLFPGQNAVGQSLGTGDKDAYEVIAVVGDTHYRSIREAARACVYMAIFPIADDDRKPSYTAVVRFHGPAAPLAAAARTIAAHISPDIPAPVMTTMSSTIDDSIASERMMAMLSVFFAACALLVTGIGLYGTLAYTTARRTSEIGIRMALGARRLQVLAMVLRSNVAVTLSGCVVGLIAAMAASRVLASFLYGTSVRDPWVMVGSVMALAAIACGASLMPALRASRIEPMEALRTE